MNRFAPRWQIEATISMFIEKAFDRRFRFLGVEWADR